VGTSGLVRHRLLAELRPAHRPTLGLVVAPAGSGKTTLLAHFADCFHGPVGWLSLNPADAEPDVLVARLHDHFPVPLPAASGPRDLVNFVRDVRDASATDALLVVDDAHAVDGSLGEAALAQLLVARPPQLHILIGSRRTPGFNLSRHELAGLVVVDAERLRFRTWEVEQLLRDVYGEPLPPTDTAALTRRLGGWVAGLHLFHLSTRGHPLAERRAAVAALDGRAALCRAYLAHTVMAELPAHLRDFLMRTSVFDTLTAERCDRLLGRRDSRSRLEELSRMQAFTATPDGGLTYRYHEVMRSHLALTLADEAGPEAARRCHSEAAALLEAEDALIEAARAHARAEDWASVRRLLHRVGAGIAEAGVEPWRDLLPNWMVAEDPWLLLAEGRHLLGRGLLAQSLRCFRQAEEMFSYENGRMHCRQAASRALAWLPGPARAQGHWANWLRTATQRSPATVALQAEQLAGPGGQVVRIVGNLLAGHAAEARFLVANADLDEPGVAGLALRLLDAAAAVAVGDPAASARLATVAVEAETADLPWFDRMARAAIALDGDEQSAKTARAVADECARDGDTWGQLIAMAVAGLLHVGIDETGADAVATLSRLCRQVDAPVVQVWARALHAVADAASGGLDGQFAADEVADDAHAAGVPGARAAAMVAAARRRDDQPELMRSARRLAAECGVPSRLADAWAGPEPRRPFVALVDAATVLVCLGAFQARFDGHPVDLSKVRPRARVLMRLLAMQAGERVHRDVLVNALWPDAPEDAANHNLHVAMWSLRRLLEPEATRGRCRLLIRDGDAYLLNLPADAYCDVATVRWGLAAARRAQARADTTALADALRTVLSHYSGDLLPGDGSAEWVVHEREALRRAVSQAGVTLAALELDRGEVGAAVAAAERGIAIDRYNDEAWRLLIIASQRDEPATARHAQSRYRQVLAELDLVPAELDLAPAELPPGQRGPPANAVTTRRPVPARLRHP
jgi:DNA-binding SARP family transcriptional activator